MNITRNTRPIASSSVITTFWMEILTKVEVSYGIFHSTPCGKNGCISAMRSRTAVAVASALPDEVSCTPIATDGLPFMLEEKL